MADEEGSTRDMVIDVGGAVALGITTILAAFGAYQSALWGGNQATGYTQAINTLGEANREMLRGVQERSFDTTVWMEEMKAKEAAETEAAKAEAEAEKAAAAAAPGAPGAVPAAAAAAAEEEEKPQTKEEMAVELADELTEVGDLTIAKKMDKLLNTRRELVAALKWADAEGVKLNKGLTKDKRLEIARQVVDLSDKQEKVFEQQVAILEKLELGDSSQEEIDEALKKNPDAKAQIAKLDDEYDKLSVDAEKVFDKLAKPLFFDSTAYTKSQERRFLELQEKGNKEFEEGQKANTYGDKYTLATVFHTVALFFMGLSAVLKKFPIKATFLVLGSIIAFGATLYMFGTPMAGFIPG